MSSIDNSSPFNFLKTMRLDHYETASDFFFDMNEQIEKIEERIESKDKQIKILEELVEEAYPEMMLLKYKHHPSGSDKFIDWQERAKQALAKLQEMRGKKDE